MRQEERRSVTSERGPQHDQAEPQLGVFLNYRRSDTAPYARLLGDALRSRFGDGQVFTDVDAIGLGADFPSVIEERVQSSDVLLALIGKGWLTATDNQGQPRLGQAGDWVRLEIEAALERNVPVVPTLVEGATMPSSDELPDSLKPLAARQGIELRDGAPWDSDVDRLLRALERIAGEKAERDTASPPKIQAEREAVEAPPEPGGRQADAEPKRPSVAPANAFAARTAQLTSFGMTPQAAQLLTMNLLRALEQDENILAACRYADATLPTPDGDAVAHAKPGALHARPSRYAGNVVATERQLVVVAGWPKVERHVNLPWSRIRAVRMDVEPYRIWRFSVREGARITVTLADSATELSFVSYDLERAKALRDVASARIRAARS